MSVYASPMPSALPQPLPSFRELLPPHLHDEIESSSYLSSPRYHGRSPSDPYAYAADSPPLSSPSGSIYGVSPPPPPTLQSPPTPPQTQYATTTTTTTTTAPILPPIRDLHSVADAAVAAGAGAGTSPTSPTAPISFHRPSLSRSSSSSFSYPSFAATSPVTPRTGSIDASSTYPEPTTPPYVRSSYPYGRPESESSSATSSSSSSARRSTLPTYLRHHSANFVGSIPNQVSEDKANKRRRGNLPKPVTDILRAWFHDHLDHPYPSEEDKLMFMSRTGLSISQVSFYPFLFFFFFFFFSPCSY